MYVTIKAHERKAYNGLVIENPEDRNVKLWIAPLSAIVESPAPPPKVVTRRREPND